MWLEKIFFSSFIALFIFFCEIYIFF
jgi:hypothetical protein